MHSAIVTPCIEKFQTSFGRKDTANMGQQHRPVFRKRSLSELPGNVRAPVFKKPERLKSRIEASLAGLRELESLREKHQLMFSQAMTSLQAPASHLTIDTSFQDPTLEGKDFKSETDVSKEDVLVSSVPTLQRPASEHAPLPETRGHSAGHRQGEQEIDIHAKETENQTELRGDVTSQHPEQTPERDQCRPRSFSLSHCPSTHKSPRTLGRRPSAMKSSVETVASSDEPGFFRKRKGSIFEGVDINIQGPNPIHAILMQYGPLSSTQSMPSVCATLPRRHCSLPSRSTEANLSRSNSTCSKDSVFSTPDSLHSSTHTDIVAKNKSTGTIETLFVRANQHSSEHSNISPRDKMLLDPPKERRLNTNLRSHLTMSSPEFTKTKHLSEVMSTSPVSNVSSKIKRLKDFDKTGVIPKIESTECTATDETFGFVDGAALGHEADNICSKGLSDTPVRVHRKDSRCSLTTLSTRPNASKGTQVERPPLRHNARFGKHRNPSAFNDRLTQSVSNIPCPNGDKSPNNNTLSNSKYPDTPSKPSGQEATSDVKKVRRFGLPLDSKLVRRMLSRQNKLQPINTNTTGPTGTPTDSRQSKSPSFLPSRQSKENNRHPRSTGESSDDDEYGMTCLLSLPRQLTSTPLHASMDQPSPVASMSSYSSRNGVGSPNGTGHKEKAKGQRRHKLSFRSERTCASSDMDDSGVYSGEMSPCSSISPQKPRFHFNELSSTGTPMSDSSDCSRRNSSRSRSSPDWDGYTRKSSVSILSLSADVQESSL